MNKIAIAFGWGKQSTDILLKLIDKKPILITCIGDEIDIDERLVKMFGNAMGLKTIVLNTGKENFRDYLQWVDDGKDIKYTNTILDFYNGKKKPFNILFVGRRRIDYVKRKHMKLKNIPKEIKIKGVEFPLWNNME